MRRVFITEVDPGMRLGSSIRGPRGALLLASGVSLTEAHLRLLAARGCLIVHGEDGLTEDVDIPELLPNQVRSAGLKAMVVRQNLGRQTRPVARVLWDPSGQPIAPLEIDLSTSPEAGVSLPLPPWPGGNAPAPRDWGTIRAAAAVEAVSAMVC